MDIEMKSKNGIKLLLKGKICENDIDVKPKLKDEKFTKNGTYPIPEGFAGHGLITVDVKSSVSVTGVYTFNDSIVKTGAREFSSYDDTGYGEYISDVNNYIVCKNDDGTFSYILPVYVLAENIFLVFRHEGEIGEEAGSDIYYEDYNRESVDNQLSGLVVNINSAPSNLTEWILANATPESGGECSGEHIIVVDELPEVGVEGAYYKTNQFSDVVIVTPDGECMVIGALFGEFPCFTATQETLSEIQFDEDEMVAVYLTDISEIYTNMLGDFEPLSVTFNGEITFKGEISSIDFLEVGYYAYTGSVLYEYVNGQYTPLFKIGNLIFSSNGDGTCSVTGIGANNDRNIVIPSVSPSGDTVTSIEAFAFYNTLIESLEIPDTVTSIDSNALVSTIGPINVIIGDGITEIGMIFNGCASLQTVTFPKNLQVIDTWAFDGCCSLDNVTLPASLTAINGAAFKGCHSLKNIIFEGTVAQWNAVYLGYNPFDGIPATKVECSDGSVNISGSSSSSGSSGTTTPAEVTSEEAEVTPSESTQYVTPQNADYLSKVTVKAIPPEYKKVSGSTTVSENNKTVDVTNLASLTVSIPEFDGTVVIT